jgi:hypothetical protein
MAYNPDEEPTRQIRYRPEGMPNQPANTPMAGPPPQRTGSNPASSPEPYPAAVAPWQDYPPQPYGAFPPAAPPSPPTPIGDEATAPTYSYYAYPPSTPAASARQPRGNTYSPAPPRGSDAADVQSSFNVRQFWHDLTLSGQVSGIAGILMLIFFSLPWLYTPDFKANLSGKTTIPTVTHSGWGTAAGAQIFSNVPALNLFPHLWLVLLCALALIALAVLLGLHRISLRRAALLLTTISLGALLLEFFFLLQVGSLGNAIRIGISATSDQTLYGTSWGFWLTVVTTIATLGVGIHLLLEIFRPEPLRKPRAPGMSGGPDQYPTPTA